MIEQINKILDAIKQEKPLILNITNNVTMDFVANGLLSIGASPVMSTATEEIEALMHYAKAVVINIGTLNQEFISLCHHTCKIANQLNIPIIFDPVGAGATSYRTDTCIMLMNQFNIAIIRGNASEIMALSGLPQKTKGVDSLSESNHAIESAKSISKQCDAAVVISGKTDFIIDHDIVSQLDHGSPLMPLITGSGCLLTAVVAAFHAIENDRLMAASMATFFYCICGEHAEKKASGPGSFRFLFLDALHHFPKGI